MKTRTLGVEEELLVVDPAARSVTSRAREVLEADAERGHTDDGLGRELFRHQLETRTEPVRDLDDLRAELVSGRGRAEAAAAERGLAVAASATIPVGLDEPQVSSDDRYRDIVDTYGALARLGTTCGMHVHVAIDSPEEGVGCLDRIAPWLPVLLAMSANSPYAAGRDTGHASWRTQQWSSWPSAGPTEAFGSLAQYHRTCERMLASGAARDSGMLYLDARLSDGQPTVEVRILDAVTEVEDAVLLAALVRGLVETSALLWAADRPPLPWRCEELRAARWRAARFGLAGTLLHPVDHELRPAREVVAGLVDLVGDRLEAAGDAALVAAGVERVLAATGASRQRAAFERTGSMGGVVDDLVARTRATRLSPQSAPGA